MPDLAPSARMTRQAVEGFVLGDVSAAAFKAVKLAPLSAASILARVFSDLTLLTGFLTGFFATTFFFAGFFTGFTTFLVTFFVLVFVGVVLLALGFAATLVAVA